MAAPVPMDLDGEDEVLAAGNAELVPLTGAAGRGMRLIDLPDNLLALILYHLVLTHRAARLSVLSRRWRYIWCQIPTLILQCRLSHHSSAVIAVLASHSARGATRIGHLVVRFACDATPEDTASWLRFAAPLVNRNLIFQNRFVVREQTLNQELTQEVVEERGAFELPCFKKANKICLSLGFLGVSLPPAGIFAALRVLQLEYVQFHGECTLEDTMWPSLEGLHIRNSRGFTSLTIKLSSLIRMQLHCLLGLRRLDVVAPELKILFVLVNFTQLPSARIVAERLEDLHWFEWVKPGLAQFSNMPPHLRLLRSSIVCPYGGPREIVFNQTWERLLRIFPGVYHLALIILIKTDLSNCQPLMEGTSRLSDIKVLSLDMETSMHSYAATVLHFLTVCTGIRELNLTLQSILAEEPCSLNCICHQPLPSLRAQNVPVDFLEEINILNFRGMKHEVDFVKHLFKAAPALRRVRIVCHSSFAGWQELSEVLQSCASQETSVEVTSPLLPQ